MPNQPPPSPLPVSARKLQLASYLNEVEHIRRAATAANLLLEHDGALSRPATAQLGAILGEIEDGLKSLHDRRSVVMPTIRHSSDNLDAVYDVAYDASEYIYKIEALLDTMRHQLDEQPDGHLITICELAFEQMPKLRFALYGEDMGP